MNRNRLGNNGLLVCDLCLGAMIFGEGSEPSDPADNAGRLTHRSFDTANVYAGGRAHRRRGWYRAEARGDPPSDRPGVAAGTTGRRQRDHGRSHD